MHDPDTILYSIGPFLLIHRDPCTDGTDDSCGRFMRARHGDDAMLKRIRSRISMDWNYWFAPNGDQLMSTPGITLQMFWIGAFEFFGVKRYKEAKQWMRDNLWDVLQFAENPIDGLHDAITGKYGQRPKEERISEFAHIIYGWLLRDTRPWWKHPNLHVHHWRIFVRPFWRRWFRGKSNEALSNGGQEL